MILGRKVGKAQMISVKLGEIVVSNFFFNN